jgi:hypothetical protein
MDEAERIIWTRCSRIAVLDSALVSSQPERGSPSPRFSHRGRTRRQLRLVFWTNLQGDDEG